MLYEINSEHQNRQNSVSFFKPKFGCCMYLLIINEVKELGKNIVL